MIWFYHNVFLELFFSLSVRFCFGVFFAKLQKWRLGEVTASFTLVLECWFLAWREKYTNFTYVPDNAIAIANGDWSRCDSRHLTTAVWKSTMRDKLQNNINHIIQHQISQVINKIFAGKKQNAKKLKSVQNVLDNPDRAWAKMISNPAPDPKKSHNSAGSDSKNPNPGKHWLKPGNGNCREKGT